MTEKRKLSALRKFQFYIGRLLGNAKRKEKDIVDEWFNMCHANGWNTTDRVLQLIAWDLQQGGVDLAMIEQKKREGNIASAFEQAKLQEEIANLGLQYRQQILEISKQYTEQIMQLQNQIAQLQAQLYNINTANIAVEQATQQARNRNEQTAKKNTR